MGVWDAVSDWADQAIDWAERPWSDSRAIGRMLLVSIIASVFVFLGFFAVGGVVWLIIAVVGWKLTVTAAAMAAVVGSWRMLRWLFREDET